MVGHCNGELWLAVEDIPEGHVAGDTLGLWVHWAQGLGLRGAVVAAQAGLLVGPLVFRGVGVRVVAGDAG